ncbi:MAG: hypothetical protein V3R80_05980, partial [Candidatus Tectomicrobia bacterium]
LKESEIRMGAGLRGVTRGIASASSVSLAATWYQARLATHTRLLAQEQSLVTFGRDELLQRLTLTFERLGDIGQIAQGKALAMLYNIIRTEAALYTYHETFIVIAALAAVGILPALWMTTRTRTNARTQEGKPVKHVNAQS